MIVMWINATVVCYLADDVTYIDEFKELVGHGGEVEELSAKEFDPKGDYGDVLDMVKKAGSGDVKVFRVGHGRTRAEYYVVCVDGKGGRVVGLKAKAVES